MLEKPAPAPLQVFLVEDSLIERDRLALLVTTAIGAVVCGEAEDAPSAVAGILARRPHVVILDLVLKTGSGIEVLGAVKRAAPEIVVIVHTFHGLRDVVRRCEALGADHIFDKGDTARLANALKERAQSYPPRT